VSAAERPVLIGVGEVLWDVYPDAAHFGGAPANFACHSASLGADASMVSAVGIDDLGDRALDSLRERGVRCETVARDPAHRTGQVMVTLDATGQASYEFAADVAWDHLAWSHQLASRANRSDAVCFGTLAQRSRISRATIRRFVSASPPDALRVFDVNLRQRFYDADVITDSLEIANVLKLNEDELPVVAKACGIDVTGARDALRQLIDRYELRIAALTRGANGALIVSRADESESPAEATRVVDTVGAGDAFTAALVVDLIRGLPLAEMNRHANAVAAFVCSQPGATTPLPRGLVEKNR
jgi:fructokinase